jgi:hypothetical protein
MVRLVSLSVADSSAVWDQLGFVVVDGAVRIGSALIYCSDPTGTDDAAGNRGEGAPKGIIGWELSNDATVEFCVDGLDTVLSATQAPVSPMPVHPNGVTGFDHIVVSTPDIERTIRLMEEAGLELRRRREGRAYGNAAMMQAFFWLGDPDNADERIVLEVVGPAEIDYERSHEPAKFFGLALVSDDLEKTAAFFGDLMKPPVDAVQEGRRIATLSSRAGSTVAMAFMSPHA